MNLTAFILAFKIWLMRIGLLALAAIAIGGAGGALWRVIRRPIVAAWRFPHLPDLAAMTCLCVACIMYGGDKLRSGGSPAQPSVTTEEIAQGYRLESVATNDAISYAMPTCGVEYARWSLRGGRETRFALDLGDFFFPFGSGMVNRIDVLSGGTVESLPRPSLAAIRAAREWASLIPGESRFWRADVTAGTRDACPCRAKLLTWENVYAGRDRTGAYSAQIELREGGDFTTRSNNVECVYRRVPPFDWDDDGLENTVDPDPLAAGPDAHGTNAEWYNTVCSNIVVATPGGSGVSPLLEWREGVNSNAYYFVDVVAERGPAPVYFTGDRESRLGDPVVVAWGGETNRVPLLIGIRYAVTSDVPFTVSFTDSGFATIATNNGPRSAEVTWPLEFAFTEGFSSGSRVYAIDVVPYDPGGTFSWEMRGGVPLGGLRSGGCSCVSYSGRSIVFGCSAQCDCGGTCVAFGTYNYELASFDVSGGECRCGFNDPEPPGEELPPGPGLSVSFSKDAVIFEDTYEDSPGVWKPKRSTRVYLTVGASGGPNGGTLSLTSVNLGKLSAVGGSLALQSSIGIAADEGYSVSFLCEAAEQSMTEDDVIVSGVFTENNTGQVITNTATLTVVRVELLAEKVAPQNPCINRHVYGVDEKVNLLQAPAGPVIQWSALGNGCVSNLPYICYICPIRVETGGLVARHGTVTYRPLISVREPEGLECRGYGFLPATGLEGIGMALALYVFPYDVSFEGLKMQEVAAPSNATSPEWGVHEGYFSDWAFQGRWYHYAIWGGGVWMDVLSGNKFGEQDESHMFIWPEPWSAGRMTWKIPIAWKSKHSSAAAEGGRMFETYQSEWTMTFDSVIKTKHQQVLTLTENGLIFLNGERYDP